MKSFFLITPYLKAIFFVLFLFNLPLRAAGSWNFNDKFRMQCTGTVVEENIMAQNLNILNSAISEDVVDYLLTTLDYFISASYGNIKTPRVNFYTDIRFRYVWGSTAETKNLDGSLTVADATSTILGSKYNRHLLWMREGWMKMIIGSEPEKHQHFVQVGLIPFAIGRGLSLGDAYDASGFLGFTPGFSIEQYAPAVLLSANPSGKNEINAYVALTENRQNSLSEIFENVRSSEIGSCSLQGVSQKSFILALEGKAFFDNPAKNQKIMFEPYLIATCSPDKNLEFLRDIDADLSTFGVCVEAEFGKLNCGFECAQNFGNAFIKPWDRNKIQIVKQDDGQLAEQYTKIYDKSPLDPTAELVYVTSTNQGYVDASDKSVTENGEQIGPNLFNALSRFRPAEDWDLRGYFFIADAAYDYIPKVLTGGIGAGYFSGYANQCPDLNHVSTERLLHESYTGFIPVQSQYAGKRIRHLVMFNQGVARYTIATPPPTIDTENVTRSLNTDSIDSTTNIAFIGMRLAWDVQHLKTYKLLLAPNIIGYWSPETPRLKILATNTAPEHLIDVQNYLGTEVNLEFSWQIMPELKLSGYAGMLIPGSYYKSIAGTIVQQFSLPICHSLAYICDIALSYSF